MNLTKKEIDKVVELGCMSYPIMLKNVDDNNDIKISSDGTIHLFLSGVKHVSNKVYSSDLRKSVKNLNYSENVFESTDIKFSVLEIDKARGYWQDKYKKKKVKFPQFMHIVLWTMIATGKYPSIVDTFHIYKDLYLEVVPSDEQINRQEYYKKAYKDRKNIGKEMIFENETIINEELRFKKEIYENYVSGLPFNSFSAEQLLNRLYKILPSLYRDPYRMILAGEMGAESLYSLYLDNHGIDGVINSIPVLGRTRSRSGSNFGNVKLYDRHPELNNKSKILFTTGESEHSGVYLPTKEVLQKVIQKYIPLFQDDELLKTIEVDETP